MALIFVGDAAPASRFYSGVASSIPKRSTRSATSLILLNIIYRPSRPPSAQHLMNALCCVKPHRIKALDRLRGYVRGDDYVVKGQKRVVGRWWLTVQHVEGSAPDFPGSERPVQVFLVEDLTPGAVYQIRVWLHQIKAGLVYTVQRLIRGGDM